LAIVSEYWVFALINYVSSGGESIDRALQTLLTCYGVSYQRYVFPALPDWQLDELLCDDRVHAIVSECEPVRFSIYLERLPLTIDTRAHWWQILPPCDRELEKVVALVAGFTAKYKYLKYSFLVSQAYAADVWKTIFSRVDGDTLRMIGQKNVLARLPDIDLQKLNYTAYYSPMERLRQRQIRSCLVYPRSDRCTNAKAADLLLIISQIHPYFYYQSK
jgi:hypothetical protein